MSLEARLSAIAGFEKELLNKAAKMIAPGAPVYAADLFVVGALRRAVAVAAGFRNLIEAKNFLCAAALLRMQIDTAARINGLRFVADRNALANRVVFENARFDKEQSSDGKNLSDAFLIAKLSEDHPWIARVYKETSGFVHLSERPFFASITRHQDPEVFFLSISGEDPERPESDYFEVLDTFLEACKVAGTLILGYLHAAKIQSEGRSSTPSIAEATSEPTNPLGDKRGE